MSTINLSISFTDKQLTGIAQATTAYNASLPKESTPLTPVEYLSYVLLKASDSYAIQYAGSPAVDLVPVILSADWEGLKNRLLAGDLNFIFARLTLASLSADANAISTARGDISDRNPSIVVINFPTCDVGRCCIFRRPYDVNVFD